MRKEVTASDFIHGNFIQEAPSVIEKGKTRSYTRRMVTLSCLYCTKAFNVLLSNALRTQQKCCGVPCYKKLIEDFDGGNEKHPLYSRWLSMKQRCNNPTSDGYINYGARGIMIEDHLLIFKNYVEYLESLPDYPTHLSSDVQVDRVDNNLGYVRGNLRWACRSTQVANQNPKQVGKYWSKFTGVSYSTFHSKWIGRVNFKGKTYCSSTHDTEELALAARNKCIVDNGFPHPIQSI